MIRTEILDSEFSVRLRNCLYNAGIDTFEQLATHSAAQLMKTKNFGWKSLRAVREGLAARGLCLRFEQPKPSEMTRLRAEIERVASQRDALLATAEREGVAEYVLREMRATAGIE